MDTPIKRAVKSAGNQSALALALNVHPSLVSQWATERRPVAAQHCVAIERTTGGEVTRYDLRPDVFGPAPDAAKREVEEVRRAG